MLCVRTTTKLSGLNKRDFFSCFGSTSLTMINEFLAGMKDELGPNID
jgi:hypothetical protein